MDIFAQIAAQLGLDHTFYYLFGMMVLLYAFLSVVYLKPYQKLLHDRKERTEGLKKKAQELLASAEQKFAQYQTRMKEANAAARRATLECEDAGKKEEARILGDAAARAKASLQATQKELDSQRKTTLEQLAGELSGIAAEIASKALGRPVGNR